MKRLPLRPLVADKGDTLRPPGLEATPAIAVRNLVDAGLRLEADPDPLFRVLVNLGRNAVQALQARGLDAAGGDWIAVSAQRQAGETRILFADSGPGIPEKAREGLFRPFADTTRVGGSGLGLAIAAELVRAHGGRIRLMDDAEAQQALAGAGAAGTPAGRDGPDAPGAVFEIVLPG